MTPDEATRYAARYHNTWRGGPSADVLREQFTDMDAEPLGRTLVELARETDQPPTVREIWQAYRRRVDPTTRTPSRRKPTEDCEHCRGCGFEAGPPQYETILGEPHEYSTVVPCRCTQPRATHRAPVTPSLLEDF